MSETAEKVYIETRGTNATVAGRHGIVTGFTYSNIDGQTRGAFFATDDGTMMFLELGAYLGERDAWKAVESAREITRDQFDILSGLAPLRSELGWR